MTNGRLDAGTLDVLLVEDNPGDARLLAEYLSEAKLVQTEPDRAATLEAALDRLRDGVSPPDVVLLDLGLPDATGLEAVEAVVEAAPDVAVIVLTGRDDRQTAVEALQEGAEDYLLKGEAGVDVLTRSIRYAMERKRAETENRRQKQRFAALIENVSDVISVIAPDGTIRYQSPSVKRVLGYEPEDLKGEDILEYVHPDDQDRVRRELGGMGVGSGGATIGEARFRHAEGSWRVLEARGRTPPEGADIGGAIIVFRDVTEKVKRRREAEKQQAKLDRILATSADGILLTDAEGNFTFANSAAEEMLGLEASEIASRSYRDPKWELRGPDGGELPDEELPVARVLRTRKSLKGVEFSVTRPDGTRRVLSGNYAPLMSPEGELQGIVVSFRDVTEIQQARVALEQAKEMFEGVFETSPVGLKIVDAEMNEYRTVNEVFTEQFGYTREEVEAGEVRDRDLWLDLDMRRRVYGRLTAGEPVRNVEVRLRRKDGSTFDALFSASSLFVEDRRFVVGAIQDISYQKEVERELQHRTLHDDLTGLPNRALLDDRLRHALERCESTGEGLGVCFLDLKRFKVINDSLGHEAGDRVLEEVADRLRAAVRERDTVARVGGDEFAVLLEDVEGESNALAAADRLVRAFADTVQIGDQAVAVEASIGITVHKGVDGNERPATTDLLRWADEAMYRAKEQPGTARVLADPDHPATDTSQFRREQRFREAVETGEIDTVYQPIVGLQDGEIRSVEALARWTDSELGQVPPGTFIPMAEETGLIVKLGEQQMEAACRDLLSEDLLGTDASPLRLQLNLSSRQLEDPEVIERVSAVLERTGFPPGRLCLEVTESAAAREPAVVDRLGKLGVELAIDDFGTGYATLGQLKRLRVDVLKIDRSFVAGLPEDDRDRAIVESVLTLGHALGLTVVAEGVETAEQWDLLRELGVDEAQGFHMARPMALEELREWMEARS